MENQLQTRPENQLDGRFDISDAVQAIIYGRGQDVDDMFFRVIEQIDHQDLQLERVELLRERYRQLSESLLDDPYQSIRSEITLLAQLYDNRSLREGGAGSLEVTHFGTRTQDHEAIDIHFSIANNEQGQQWMRLTTNLQGSLEREEPCIISAGPDGQIKIERRGYRRGGYVYYEVPVDSEAGQNYLKAVLADTLWAAHLNYTRTPEEIVESDQQAKRLLIAKLRVDRQV